MIVQWLPAALQDFEAIVDYIAADNPGAALAMGDAIESQIAGLGRQPRMGRPGRVEGTRELVIGHTPFLAVYRTLPGRVQLLRILHGAQQWPPGTESTP